LRYKDKIKKYESSSVSREVKQLLIAERKANQKSIPKEQKTYVKPQIETISSETQTITKEATQDGGIPTTILLFITESIYLE